MMMYGSAGISERAAFSFSSRFCKLAIAQVSTFCLLYPVFTDKKYSVLWMCVLIFVCMDVNWCLSEWRTFRRVLWG